MSRTVEGFSLREFEVLIAVSEQGGFRNAARSLHMPASSVSHVVGSLEARLGITLFRRTTRSVSLTEAGQDFLDRLRPALKDLSSVLDSVNRYRDTPTGLIRLNTSELAAERAMPMILSFMARYPEISVDVVTDGRLIDIVANGYDAGLRFAEAVPQDMVSIPVGPDEALIIVGAPDYLDRAGWPEAPGDLLSHECIRSRLPSGAAFRWEVQKGPEQSWIDVDGRLTVGTMKLALHAALAGTGLAYVDVSMAEPHLRSGTLVQLLPAWTPAFPGVCLYYPKQRNLSAAFRAFRDHFRDEAATRLPAVP